MDVITGEMRDHLKHEVEHFSHLLPSQGPIGTFIHHNTLHGLQHLPFEEAVAEAQRVMGGRGYLPNEEYRRFYAVGRITDEDIGAAIRSRPALTAEGSLAALPDRQIETEEVCRIHLLRGIESVDPAQLRYEILERDATRRFRDDVPPDVREALIARSGEELVRGLDQVGRTWTLAGWMQAHVNVDMPGWLRAQVTRQLAGGFDASAAGPVEPWLSRLTIPADRWDGYLECIDQQLQDGLSSTAERDAARIIWLREEAALLKQLARRHFGSAGTLEAIASHFAKDPEAYALLSLWHGCLAALGVADPFSPTDPGSLQVQDPYAEHERLLHHYRDLDESGGSPIPLSPELRAAIQAVASADAEAQPGHLGQTVLRNLSATSFNSNGLEALAALLSGGTSEGTAPADLLATLNEREPRNRMLRFAERTLGEQIEALGRDRSLGGLLEDLTGVDLAERVDRYMIKQCANFLDEGLAAWRMPERSRGFYDAWRGLALDGSLEFVDLPGWRSALEQLPGSAEDAVIQQLQELGVPEEQWGAYLGRLLIRLPGWGGMISWRATRPEYARQQAQPIDLIQFLAVRLFYETLLLQQLCRATWQLDGSVSSLHRHFLAHLPEFFARRELFLGHLPEHLAQEGRALVEVTGPRNGHDDDWAMLATKIWIHGDPDGSGRWVGRTAFGDAWRLFHLAQFLGLTGADVRLLADAERERLLGALDAFPASGHGAVWLTAYEHHYREQILNALGTNHARGRWRTRSVRPRAQVVYCIDEREEAIRRHLEELDPALETLGAAGFFGVAMNYCGLGVHEATPLCPPVITPAHRVEEVARPDDAEQLEIHTRRAKWSEVLHNTYWEIKRNFVSAYFLLDVVGFLQTVPLFGQVLAPRGYARATQRVGAQIIPPVRTALTVTRADDAAGAEHGAETLGFTTVEQADRVETMLRNLGLTAGFARLVVFTGHGSSSVNNPHESAHDCGACGGKHGGPSARLFAAMANGSEVRGMLQERGIEIPDDTWFVGSQHNTCSELYTYFDVEDIPATHGDEWRQLVADLDEARARSAQERCRRFGSSPKDASPQESLRHIEGRSVDLSQVRPEWGHATNAFAVIGRRSVTQGLFLDRRPFLISYDPTQDSDGKILERIILAVGPVGAGINLEYYFSTVDNQRYGADTKVPHNVYGMVGVMEGAMSDLRTGLPKQMVEVHEPMRLQLVIEASLTHLGEIYGRQPAVQQLLDNAWVHLIALDPESGTMNLFVPGVGFVPWERPLTPLPVVQSSFEWYRGKTDFLPPAAIAQGGGEPQGGAARLGTA